VKYVPRPKKPFERGKHKRISLLSPPQCHCPAYFLSPSLPPFSYAVSLSLLLPFFLPSPFCFLLSMAIKNLPYQVKTRRQNQWRQFAWQFQNW
jgi:hypothetical protein